MKTCKLNLETFNEGGYITDMDTISALKVVNKNVSRKHIWTVEDESGTRYTIDPLEGNFVRVCVTGCEADGLDADEAVRDLDWWDSIKVADSSKDTQKLTEEEIEKRVIGSLNTNAITHITGIEDWDLSKCDMSTMFQGLELGLGAALGVELEPEPASTPAPPPSTPTLPDDRIEAFMDKTQSALDTSVGQSEYHKKTVQPYHIWAEYPQNPWRNDIVKRTIRTKDGERERDMGKMEHIANILKENPHWDWYLDLGGKTLEELYEASNHSKIVVELKFK